MREKLLAVGPVWYRGSLVGWSGKSIFSSKQSILFLLNSAERFSFAAYSACLTITILHITSLWQNVLGEFFYAIVPGNDAFLGSRVIETNFIILKRGKFSAGGPGRIKMQQKTMRVGLKKAVLSPLK